MNTKHIFRTRRDFQGLEQRRFRAARLFKRGVTQANVAQMLDVSRQSVSRWYQRFRFGGQTRLRGAGRAGRKPRLSTTQLVGIDRSLRQGARHHGFTTDLWTLPRISTVIQRRTTIRYHPGHVWKILQKLNWTIQRPARKAKERNEEAIKKWVKHSWPAIKKKPAPYGVG